MSRADALEWSKLDNAAKIFPSTSNDRDSKVFRFACALREQIEPEALQTALDHTVERFPFYCSILKKGLFWYYLEASSLRPRVHAEDKPPCAPLYSEDRKDLLFRVTYYGNRINFEVYHALTDGTGALHFLRTLVYYYLLETHRDAFGETPPAFDYDAPQDEKSDDSFNKYYENVKGPKAPKAPKAYKLKGIRLAESRTGVVEGRGSVKALLAKAHEYGATVTELLTALLMCAIYEGMRMRDRGKPVVISIPVNLRNFFPSASARNFFGVVNVGYTFRNQDPSLEAVLAYVKKAFAENLTADALSQRMNALSALEHNFSIKLVPLLLKNPVLQYFNWQVSRGVTATFSNVGKVTMPEEMTPYIAYFDVFIATPKTQACMCSFQDDFVISFTSSFVRQDIQRRFFRKLAEMGLALEITSNLQ